MPTGPCRRWEPWEDALIRDRSSFDELIPLLPGRSRPAMKNRAVTLRAVRPIKQWTNKEVATLIKLLSEGATTEQVAKELGVSRRRVGTQRLKLWHEGQRFRRPPSPSGDPLRDPIKLEAYRQGINLKQLGRLAGCRQKHEGKIAYWSLATLQQAAEALNMEIIVKWDD